MVLAAAAAGVSGASACALAVASHGPGRVALAAATLALGSWAAVRWLFGRGPRGVVGLTWDTAGAWRIQQAGGRSAPVRLTRASTFLRTWTLLTWADTAGRRYYAFLDAAIVGQREYATLRSRLRLELP